MRSFKMERFSATSFWEGQNLNKSKSQAEEKEFILKMQEPLYGENNRSPISINKCTKKETRSQLFYS